MNYSRRQLEAFGEPIGECVTRKEGGRIIYGGGSSGGGGAPASQTQISDLPDWAKPYAKETLGKASALTDISQNPYQVYSKDRIAGFDPMQEQAMRTASSPEEFGKQVQGYMSPYMQNVVDVQKREAMRSAGILGAQQQAKATGAGAFGGYREGIQRAEDNRNLMRQMGDIQAMGSQRAFEQGSEEARRAQALQMQFGGMRQGLEQQKLTQGYQDFLNQQKYPYQQLEFMSNILRGTPMGSVQTLYQAPQSTLGQLAGLGIGLGGMARFGQMFAEGGQVDGYADGGSVTSDYKVDQILNDLSDAQLQQARMAAINARDAGRVEAIDEEIAERASLRSGLGSAFNTLPEETQEAVTEMASGGIVAFAGPTEDNNYSLVQDPQFGGSSAGAMEMDRVRIENERARRAAQEDEARMRFLRQSAPETYERVMAQRPPASAPRAAQEAPPAAPRAAPPEAPRGQQARREEGRPARASASISQSSAAAAVRTITEAANVQLPKDETQELAKKIREELNARSEPERKQFKEELEAAKNRSKEIEARSIGEAMMKFGFGMAAAAAKPGAGRGIAGVFSSAAAASPLIAESMAETNKLKQAAQDNYMKLRMENARYETALEQGNMQLAASLANNISTRQLEQEKLKQQIFQQDRLFGLEEKKLAAVRSQAGRPGSALEMAYNVLRADPKNKDKSNSDLLEDAAKKVGFASNYRTDTSADIRRQDLLRKELGENMAYKMLGVQLATAKTPEERSSIQQRMNAIEADAARKVGIQSSGGVGSATQVYRFDSKGNPVQ